MSSATTTVTNGKDSSIQKNLKAIDTFGNVFEAPDYSINEVLKAIPARCFKRSAIRGLSYVFRDILCMLTSYYIAHTYIPLVTKQNSPAFLADRPESLFSFFRGSLWLTYCYIQSLFGTGLWVLAHECGHRAFSDYETVDNIVGWILHSYLLVPFFSWKITHRKHHNATGHLTKDMVFVPKTKEEYIKSFNDSKIQKLADIAEDSPFVSLCNLLKQQFGGWITYLLTNVTGQTYPEYANRSQFVVNHFNPTAPIFDKSDYYLILISDLGILAQLIVLYFWITKLGKFSFFVDWFLPYIGVNHWLVFITFLQHSDPKMPHYDAYQWNFARGAAATIDREFPFIGPYLFHDIIETHVLHHYVSRIPFYNAREATEAIKKVMGKHYMYTDENMWVSLWKSARTCQFVDETVTEGGDRGIRMYRNVNGFGVEPVDLDGKVLKRGKSSINKKQN